MTVRRSSFSDASSGTSRRHFFRRSAGVERSTGSPHRYRGSITSSSISVVSWMHARHSPRAGTITSHVRCPLTDHAGPATNAAVAPFELERPVDDLVGVLAAAADVAFLDVEQLGEV